MRQADGRRHRRRSALVIAVAGALLAGCGGGDAAPSRAVVVPATIAIGDLPGELSGTTVATLPVLSIDTTTTTTEPDREPISGPLVDDVVDHRVLLIGDTALAATTERAGGNMCDVVTDFGWDVEVEAEPGRTIRFADEVLDTVAVDDWDVVGLMFGHHLDTTVDDYEIQLDGVLDRIGERPVILYTVAELDPEQAEVNRILRQRQRSRPNIVIIDWAGATEAEPEKLLVDGGPRPTDEGAGRLSLFTAALLSSTESGVPGTCVESRFTDDSAIVL